MTKPAALSPPPETTRPERLDPERSGPERAGFSAHDPAAWAQTRHVSLSRARTQARQLRWARTAFIALSALSGGSVIVFAIVHSITERLSVTQRVEAEEAIALLRPRFLGRDAQGREFSVSAESAVRSAGDEGPIALRKPVFENANKQSLGSPEGDYDNTRNRLVLRGGVVLKDDRGNQFFSPVAEIDTSANVARGNQGMTGEGPLGSVRAEAYEVFNLEGRFVLRGNVRGVIKQERKRK